MHRKYHLAQDIDSLVEGLKVEVVLVKMIHRFHDAGVLDGVLGDDVADDVGKVHSVRGIDSIQVHSDLRHTALEDQEAVTADMGL